MDSNTLFVWLNDTKIVFPQKRAKRGVLGTNSSGRIIGGAIKQTEWMLTKTTVRNSEARE